MSIAEDEIKTNSGTNIARSCVAVKRGEAGDIRSHEGTMVLTLLSTFLPVSAFTRLL